MPISTLSTLLKSLGTFFTKYYPYKKFVNSLCHAYSLIGKQFETTLDDLKYDFIETVRLCYYKLDKKEDHLPVGINCYLSNDFYYVTKPLVGDTRGIIYSVEKPKLLDYSENIKDFKLVADGILAPQNI